MSRISRRRCSASLIACSDGWPFRAATVGHCRLTDRITTEKGPRGLLWPLWPFRRRIPITLTQMWFERHDGTQFDIVLRNGVSPGQVGTRVSILEAVDSYGNGFLYSIYNHAAGRWRRLNQFANLWHLEMQRPPVKWERWMLVACAMPVSTAVWISMLLRINQPWLTWTFRGGLAMGVILLIMKAIECARLWHFLGRAESAVELASVDQPHTVATDRSETLNKKDR
jgi:hypothetical protein